MKQSSYLRRMFRAFIVCINADLSDLLAQKPLPSCTALQSDLSIMFF